MFSTALCPSTFERPTQVPPTRPHQGAGGIADGEGHAAEEVAPVEAGGLQGDLVALPREIPGPGDPGLGVPPLEDGGAVLEPHLAVELEVVLLRDPPAIEGLPFEEDRPGGGVRTLLPQAIEPLLPPQVDPLPGNRQEAMDPSSSRFSEIFSKRSDAETTVVRPAMFEK